MLTVQGAIDKLAACGSARQIADHLAAEGCTGVRQSALSCPVSVYLRRAAGVRTVSVDGVRASVPTVESEVDLSFYTVTRYPLPVEVRLFVSGFDAGEFSQLER